MSITQNSTIALVDGASTNVSCKFSGERSNWLAVCFGKYDQSFNDFTNVSINEQYCTFCPGSSQGKCILEQPRPEWEVYRKEEGECGDILENDIIIKDFSKNDEGNILCFYVVDRFDKDQYYLYTTYTLTYKTGTSKLYIVYIVVVGVVVLLSIILAVAYRYRLWRRRKGTNYNVSILLGQA